MGRDGIGGIIICMLIYGFSVGVLVYVGCRDFKCKI